MAIKPLNRKIKATSKSHLLCLLPIVSVKMHKIQSRSDLIGKSAVSIGRFTYGFEHIQVNQWNEGAKLNIGSFCSIATNVTIFLGGNHRSDWVTTFPFGYIYVEELGGSIKDGLPATKGDVNIGSDVWIGSGVTIMSGINVGDGAVLATNATVVKDVEPYEIVGGNPAKKLKSRFDNETITLLLALRWWDLPLETIKELETKLCSPPEIEFIKKLIAKYRI